MPPIEMMRGFRPDGYTYTVLASAYSNAVEMEQAGKILAEAKKLSDSPHGIIGCNVLNCLYPEQ